MSRKGYLVFVISSDPSPLWFSGHIHFTVNDPFDKQLVAQFDRVIATTYRLAECHWRLADEQNRLWHFVQGFEGDYSEYSHLISEIDYAYRLPIPRITVSQNLANRLSWRFPGNNTFQSIGQGLEHDVFYPPTGWERKNQNRPTRVFLVGPATISIKQIDLGLQAYRSACSRYPDLELVLITTANTKDSEEAVAGRICQYHMHISSHRIGELFREKNGILLAPSGPGEGFGLPPLEAMACAVPVVMSDISSFQNFAQPADYARFARHDNPADMAEGICEIISDGTRRMHLAERGLQVAKEYSYEKVAKRLEMALFS